MRRMVTSATVRWAVALSKTAFAAKSPRSRAIRSALFGAWEVRPDIALFDSLDAIRDPLVKVKLAFFESAALFGKSALLLANAGLEVLKPELQSLLHKLGLSPDDLLDLLLDLALLCRVVLRGAIGVAQFMQPLLILELLYDRVGQLRSPFLELEVLHRHRGHPPDQSLKAPWVLDFQRRKSLVPLGELLADEFHDSLDHLRREWTVHRPTFSAPPIAPTPAWALPAKSTALPLAGPIELLARSVPVALRRLGTSELSIADCMHSSDDQCND